MKISEYVQLLKKEFYLSLDKKTGWGKEEVKREFEAASERVLLEMLYNEETK